MTRLERLEGAKLGSALDGFTFEVDMGRSTPPLETFDQQEALLEDKQRLPLHRTRLAQFQAVLEEGHAAAGTTILISVVMGLALGFAVPTDKNLPGRAPLP